MVESLETCDSIKRELEYSGGLKDENIADLKKNLDDRSQQLIDKDGIISEKDERFKNKKKIWRNRSIYFSAGSLVVGFITGLIIVR